MASTNFSDSDSDSSSDGQQNFSSNKLSRWSGIITISKRCDYPDEVWKEMEEERRMGEEGRKRKLEKMRRAALEDWDAYCEFMRKIGSDLAILGTKRNNCLFCKHLNPGGEVLFFMAFSPIPGCKAFKQIPLEIWVGMFEHTDPYPGDEGIRYEPRKYSEEEEAERRAAGQVKLADANSKFGPSSKTSPEEREEIILKRQKEYFELQKAIQWSILKPES